MAKQSVDIDRRVAERIRALRDERGLSVRQLAIAAKLGPEVVSRAERGLNAPSVNTLARICDGLGLSLSNFFDWSHALPAAPAPREAAAERVRELLARIPEGSSEQFAEGLALMSNALEAVEREHVFPAAKQGRAATPRPSRTR